MNGITLNNQLEIPLRQVAQLLQVPAYVVVRLAIRLQNTLQTLPKSKEPLATPLDSTSAQEKFYTLAQIHLLEDCIQAIRQGYSLVGVLEEIKRYGSTTHLNSQLSSAKQKPTPAINMKRLPAYQAKTPLTRPQKKAIPPVKKNVYTTPQPFPVLKKRTNPPADWFNY
jgi:hypothetical protein